MPQQRTRAIWIFLLWLNICHATNAARHPLVALSSRTERLAPPPRSRWSSKRPWADDEVLLEMTLLVLNDMRATQLAYDVEPPPLSVGPYRITVAHPHLRWSVHPRPRAVRSTRVIVVCARPRVCARPHHQAEHDPRRGPRQPPISSIIL